MIAKERKILVVHSVAGSSAVSNESFMLMLATLALIRWVNKTLNLMFEKKQN